MRYIASILFFLFIPLFVHAVGSSGLVDGIWFSHTPLVSSKEVIVYSVLHNQTPTPLKGMATLMVDNTAVAAIKVNISTDGIQRVGIPYTFSVGRHTVYISFTPQNGISVTRSQLTARHVQVHKSIPLKKEKSSKSTTQTFFKTFLHTKATTTSATTSKNNSVGIVAVEKVQKRIEKALPLLAHVEKIRKESATAVTVYTKEHNKKLAILLEKEKKQKNAEGFSPSVKEQSDIRRQQIAAAGSTTLGFMLDNKWVFFAEILVLLFGIMHLLWVWIKALLRPRQNEVQQENDIE